MPRIIKFHVRASRVYVRSSTAMSLGMFLLAALVGFEVWHSPLLRVQVIQCKVGQDGVCPDEVVAELSHLKGQPMYMVDTLSTQKKILQGWSVAKTVQIETQLPHTIKAQVFLQSAAYVVKVASSSAVLVVSENGKVLRNASEEDIASLTPTVLLVQGSWPSIGQSIETASHSAIWTTVQQLRSSSLPVQRIEFYSPHQLELVLGSGKRGVIEGENAAEQLSALQQLLNTSTIIQQGVQRIDVRFFHPVLH